MTFVMERKVMEREGMTKDREIRRSEKRSIQGQIGKEKKKRRKRKNKREILTIDFKISTSNDSNLLKSFTLAQ